MEQSVQKFIEYLETFVNSIMIRTYKAMGECFITSKLNNNGDANFITFWNSVHQFINDNDMDILYDTTLNWLKYFKKENQNEENKFFNQFLQLSIMLEISPLSARDSLNIMEYIIKRNLNEGILEANGLKNTILLGYNEDLKSLTADNLNPKNLIGIYWALEANEEVLDDETKKNIKIIKEFISKCEENAQNIINAHKTIKEHYIKKENKLETEDVKCILDAFKLLKFREELLPAFQQLLLKKVKKRESQMNRENQEIASKKAEIERISQKEYNKIFREIESYYDIQNQKVIRPLTLKETIYLVSLLFKIQISEKEIAKCICNINKAGLNAYHNPLTQYNDYYNKMITLTSNEEVKKSLNYIKECMQALYIPENDNDYLFWKNEVANELTKIMKLVNKEYTYEMEEGYKISK